MLLVSLSPFLSALCFHLEVINTYSCYPVTLTISFSSIPQLITWWYLKTSDALLK